MSMESPESEKDKDMNFMVSTKDGLMITFGEEPVPKNPNQHRKVLKVMDMHSMMKGSGEAIAALAKSMPKKENTEAEKKKPNDLDNFVKTGKTRQVFGYTAEEYSKEIKKEENGKMHEGTMSAWYAKVDFDPEMMFSLGMGNMGTGGAQSKVNQTHPNNMLGLGLKTCLVFPVFTKLSRSLGFFFSASGFSFFGILFTSAAIASPLPFIMLCISITFKTLRC